MVYFIEIKESIIKSDKFNLLLKGVFQIIVIVVILQYLLNKMDR